MQGDQFRDDVVPALWPGAPLTPPPAPLLTLEHIYLVVGLMFAAFALLSLFDRTGKKSLGNAAFWGLVAASLLGGSHFGDFNNGLIVLGLVGLAGFGFTGRSSPKTTSPAERKAFADLRGNWLFMPYKASWRGKYSGRVRREGSQGCAL